MDRSYKRRIVIIKKGLQFKFALFVILGMILAALTVGITHGIILSFVKIKFTDDPQIYSFIQRVNNIMYLQILILLVIGISLALLVSHKIGGPVYRLEKFFDEITETKDLSKRVYLRKGDELKDLADKINRFLDSLETKNHQ